MSPDLLNMENRVAAPDELLQERFGAAHFLHLTVELKYYRINSKKALIFPFLF